MQISSNLQENIQIKYGALSKKGTEKGIKSDPLDLIAAIEIKYNFGNDSGGIDDKVEKDLIKLLKIKEKQQEKEVELHFIYILRYPQYRKDIMVEEKKRVAKFRKWCRKRKISFHTNSPKNYFPNYK